MHLATSILHVLVILTYSFLGEKLFTGCIDFES